MIQANLHVQAHTYTTRKVTKEYTQTDIYKYTLMYGAKGLANGAFTLHEGNHFALHRMPLRVIRKKKKSSSQSYIYTHIRMQYVCISINKGLAEGALTSYKGIVFCLVDAPASQKERGIH